MLLVMERRLLSESERQWNALLKLRPPAVKRPELFQSSILNERRISDPFSCASITPPTTRALVEEVLDEHVEKWKELDQRKVVDDDSNSLGHVEKTNNVTGKAPAANGMSLCGHSGKSSQDDFSQRMRKRKSGWLKSDRRINLPEHFDYATKRSAPPADNGGGDRVISLLDPSVQHSYHEELWRLFSSVPTIDIIKRHAEDGINLPHTSGIHREITQGIQQYLRLDAHALSRMRMSDRHGMPPLVTSDNPATTIQEETTVSDNVSTIRIECWKRQPKRGTAPDPYRAVLEFLGSHTLLDVHQCLIQLAEDDLWAAVDESNRSDERVDNSAMESSGYFFIENQFYTNGNVDYVSTIQKWLDSPDRPPGVRRKYLGISTSAGKFPIKSMSETRLDQLSFRLATRYHHVCHGDVECAIFVVDMRLAPKAKVPYPILHDIWCPSCVLPQCEACHQYPVMYAVSSTCELVDGGPRTLCEACCIEMQLFDKEPGSVRLFTEWRNQQDLSSGCGRDHAATF